MEWKTLVLPLAAVVIIGAVYYGGVATAGNISSTSTAVTAIEVAFGVVGFLVVGAGLIYASSQLFGENAFQYSSIFAMYLPVTYVLVGILADIISQEYKTSAASVTAIAAILVNKLASIVTTSFLGGTTQKIQEAISENGDITKLYKTVYEGCTVPGFEGMESILAPQSIVIIIALFTFFALDIGVNHSGQSLSGLIWITITALVVQIAFINTNGCLKGEFYWMNSLIVPFMFSILIGGGVGALGWTSNRFIFPPKTGTASSGGLFGSTAGSALPPVGSPTTGSSDDNQFVCEAYKNGELITSTIAE